MAIILDSGVIIGGEGGTHRLEEWMAAHPDQEFAVAAVTVAELWHGVARAMPEHRAKRQRYIENALAAIEIIPYTEQTAGIHAGLWAQLESSGRMIGDSDLIIAATALEHECAVASFNSHHFAAVEGLTVIGLRYST
jgi:tRNA(fMet)-specific endonuclease VapC